MIESTVRRILHKDLGFHPYKMMTFNEWDYHQRLAFAELMLEIIEEHEDAIIMMSDAHFHLNSSVNKQNFRYWDLQNPHEMHERRCTARN
jgi:hypothetical protein